MTRTIARTARRLALVAMVAAAALPSAGHAAERGLSVQEATLRAKPATVLVISEVASDVSLDCGSGQTVVAPNPFRETGTGWFVDGSGGFLVTNGHVVEPAHATPRWLVNQIVQKAVLGTCVLEALTKRGLAPGERLDVEEQIGRQVLDRAVPTARIDLRPSVTVLLSNGIRLPAKVIKYSPPVSGAPGAMSGRDLALLQAEASDMPALPVETKNVRIGDAVRILGFPGVVLTHELLNASSKVEASVTNGAISGFKQDVQDQPVIQTDAPAAWGNSGGPVVNEKSEVIGVLTFVSLAPGADGGIVQGFNFIIPSSAVKEFLAGTPATVNGKSAFNDTWFAGLRALFAGQGKAALTAFAEANRLVPELPDVKRALVEAEDKVKNPPPRPFPWAITTAGITALSLSFFGALAALRWKRNRFRVAPA